jgi:hypothetical protein
MATFEIVRFYQNHPEKNTVLLRGLTEDEAKAHCQQPDTASKTATSPHAKALTARYGPWFHGYREERPYGPRRQTKLESICEAMSPTLDQR